MNIRLDEHDRALFADKLREHCGVMDRDAHAALTELDYPKAMLSQNHFEQYVAVRDDLASLLEFPGTIVLSGANGPGKTYLAAALVHAFCDALRPAFFTTAQNYYRELQKRFGKSDLMDEWHARLSGRERRTGFQLLVIDEVEVQPGNEWHLNELRDVINERYGRMVATVLITNLDSDRINGVIECPEAKYFNTAIRDRIKQIGTILPCRWPSLRAPEWQRHVEGNGSTQSPDSEEG